MRLKQQSMYIDASVYGSYGWYRQIAERRASYTHYVNLTNTIVEAIQKNQVSISIRIS